MTENKQIYYIHQKAMTYRETKEFIEQYRSSIRRRLTRYTQMLPYIPLHSYALDYGCGWGTFSEMIYQERKCRVDGIDLDFHSIMIARDFVGEKENLSFSVKNIQEVNQETYDVVISTQVAEHTLNPGAYLKECNRILKPGGYLIISVPNILTPHHFISQLRFSLDSRLQAICETSRSARDRTLDHVQAWDARTFCRLLCALGFEYEDHAFMEGVPLLKGLYWPRPVGPFKYWSYTMMFKARKSEFVDVSLND